MYLKNSPCLAEGNAWKQRNHLADGDTVFQVLEQGRNGHTGAHEFDTN